MDGSRHGFKSFFIKHTMLYGVLAGSSNIVVEYGEICSQCCRVFSTTTRPVSDVVNTKRSPLDRERAESAE